MGSTELAANLFRATQTEDKLRRDQTRSKAEANITHREIGKKVRKAFRGEQRAVKTTSFDLQANPAQPGLQFHRIDKSKDNHFWSVRVGGDIRIDSDCLKAAANGFKASHPGSLLGKTGRKPQPPFFSPCNKNRSQLPQFTSALTPPGF